MKKITITFLSILLLCEICTGQNSKKIFLSFNAGIGSTSLDRAVNLYPILNPRVGYQLSRFIVGLESNHYKVTAAPEVDKWATTVTGNNFGFFTRYYTNFKCLPLIEIKANYGYISSGSEKRKYESIAISPGWEWDSNLVPDLKFQGIFDLYYGKNLLTGKNFNGTLKLGVAYRL